jgi:beta-1,4-mannosyl-glycoprotein beta-1,4-N-acetylglucosaminyltransferase
MRHTPEVFWRRIFFELRYLFKRAPYAALIQISRWQVAQQSTKRPAGKPTVVADSKSRPRVFDCITLFDGLDLLEIRLKILDEHVDWFVIVEATTTHAGKPKPMYFGDNKERFSAYLHKIRHVVVSDMPNVEQVLHRHILTSYQRDQILRGLSDCRPDDIIYVSDFDEIPNPAVMPLAKQLLLSGLSRVRFYQRMYYYFLNGETNQRWWIVGTVAATYGNLVSHFNSSPDQLRPSEITPRDLDCIRLKEGGWHFSYLGGADAIIRKISSFEIAEMDRSEFKSREHVLEALRQGKDVFERPNFSVRYVKIDKSFPAYIQQHPDRWPHLIMRVKGKN